MQEKPAGSASVLLGAGRVSKEDKIDMSAGIVLVKKTGEYVEKGDVVAKLYTSDEKRLPDAEKMFFDAITYSDTEPQKGTLIYKTLH